ncbi:TatD family hydrolase [Candidatus Omnitrophota bacterium]
MIIDTHCHLDFEHFNSDRVDVIKRAKDAGVAYLINIGSSLEGSKRSIELAAGHENIFATVGIHPHHADEKGEDAFTKIEKLATNKKVVAIGEVGLDYFKSPSPPDKQKVLFIKFIELSKKLNLPLVIHNRDASEDTLKILKETSGASVRGVMHCFSGDEKLLKSVLEMGLFVSFTCNLTFKNARGLREVAKLVPPERLLLETDAPYLAPQAYRGKRNEPAYITELRDILSELLGLSKEEIERITTDNAKKFFRINK